MGRKGRIHAAALDEKEKKWKKDENMLARLEISVSMDISVLAFYGYIGYIGDISVDIFL